MRWLSNSILVVRYLIYGNRIWHIALNDGFGCCCRTAGIMEGSGVVLLEGDGHALEVRDIWRTVRHGGRDELPRVCCSPSGAETRETFGESSHFSLEIKMVQC